MTEKNRARNKKGEFVGDDPSTPDINEAYENIDGIFVEKKPKSTKKPRKPKKHKLSKEKEKKYLAFSWVGVIIGVFLLLLVMFGS